MLKSKHHVLRNMFHRIKNWNFTSENTYQVIVQQVLRVAYNLYGNNVASSYELTNGFIIPLSEDRLMLHVPKELLNAHNDLNSKRKLNMILRSKAIAIPSITISDLVCVYVKQSHQERDKWDGPKKVLSFDADEKSITYPVKRGKSSTTA